MNEIQNYIDNNASTTIQYRAKEIIRRKFILSLQYSAKKNIINARVLGNMPYDVIIKLKNNNPVRTQCNCPFDWPGLCKHEVAVLMEFQKNYGHLPNFDEVDEYIKDYEKIDYDFVKNISDKYTLSMGLHLADNLKIDNFDGDATLIFVVKDFKYSYYQEDQYVNVKLTNKGLKIRCTCEDGNDMCDHKVAVLLYPSQKLNDPHFFCLLDKTYRNKKIEKIKVIYGLQHAKDSNKYIHLDFDKEKATIQIKGKYAGLYPVDKEYIKQISGKTRQKIQIQYEEENFLPTPVSETPSPEKTFGVIFSFDYNSGDLVSVDSMTAHLNKKGDKPISHFKYVRLTDHPDLPDNHKNILEITSKLEKAFYESNRFNEKLPAKLTLLKELIKSLDEKTLIYTKLQDFYYDNDKLRKKDLQPVKFSKYPFEIAFEVSSNREFIEMSPVFTANGQKLNIPLNKIYEFEQSAIMILYDGILYLTQNVAAATIMEDILIQPVKKMAIGHQDTFIREIVMPYAENFQIHFDKLKTITHHQHEPILMNKKLYISGLGQFVLFRPFVQYAEGSEVNILRSGMQMEFDGNQINTVLRDTDFEGEYQEFLKALHAKFSKQYPDEFFYLDIKDMMQDHWFFTAFEQLKDNSVEVLGLNKLKNFKYNTKRANIQINISSGQDWFDVKVEVAFGDLTVSLADVRKAVLKKDRFIELSDGSIGILPEEWLNKFSRMFRHSEIKGENLKISSRKFMIIDELFEEIDDEKIINELSEKKKKLLNFTEIKRVKIPSDITAELRPYQKEGLNWLNFLHQFKWGGILADDMGLGKTLQILAFLAQRKSKKASLVVVPTTLIFNWENEIEKFYPLLKVHFNYGNTRQKTHKQFNKYDLVITAYGVVINDIEWLKEYAFNYVILDESQAIKNPLSLRFKAVTLLKARNRITLTGTPIENNTFDLFAQMHFANPGLLGTSKSFKDNFSIPIDKNGDRGRAEELRKLINPFLIRRTKEQVAKELPSKTEEVLYCHMETEQRKVYDAYRNKYRNMLLGRIEEDGLEKSKIYVLQGLMKLRQICDSPNLLSDEDNYGSTSVKIEELIRNIREKTGDHKIVVFSQFITMLGLIKSRLEELNISYEYLDGSMSRTARKESVTQFQSDDKYRVFLISLKAGGTGLNLTAADYVFLVDPWWNPAVEEQAIDRCYRIGQDKKVFAYRMICKDTIEEKIMNYKQKKKAVAADIIQAEESFMKQLTTKDIKGLFS